jgi:hypothetical protein
MVDCGSLLQIVRAIWHDFFFNLKHANWSLYRFLQQAATPEPERSNFEKSVPKFHYNQQRAVVTVLTGNVTA